MKKDKPTDVLSFPLGEKGPDGKFYLGDIVIAVPVAARQARAKGHGLDRELAPAGHPRLPPSPRLRPFRRDRGGGAQAPRAHPRMTHDRPSPGPDWPWPSWPLSCCRSSTSSSAPSPRSRSAASSRIATRPDRAGILKHFDETALAVEFLRIAVILALGVYIFAASGRRERASSGSSSAALAVYAIVLDLVPRLLVLAAKPFLMKSFLPAFPLVRVLASPSSSSPGVSTPGRSSARSRRRTGRPRTRRSRPSSTRPPRRASSTRARTSCCGASSSSATRSSARS